MISKPPVAKAPTQMELNNSRALDLLLRMQAANSVVRVGRRGS